MKQKLTYCLLFILVSTCTYAQQPFGETQGKPIDNAQGRPSVSRSFEISCEAHGFKCPFLTPKYIMRIQSLDSCNVWKTPDLVIHVEFPKPTEVTEEQLITAAVKTGYERKNITIKEITKQ